MIKMKALRSFGVAGSNEGRVHRGREFTAANEHRARELEEHGLAYMVAVNAPAPAIIDKTFARPVAASNAAAESGPLDLVGGATGAEAHAPSSAQAPARRRRRSSNSEDDSRS